MVEIRRGSDGAGGGERLPWLEPVEDEDVDYYAEAPGGYGGVIVAAIGVLLGIALLTAGIVWYRGHLAASQDIGQIIRAPAEPYKVKPVDPGGMKTDRSGEVTYGTSTGQDIDSPLDLSAMPEAPVAKPGATPAPPAAMAPPPAATPAPAPAKPAAALPPPVVAKPAPPAPTVATPPPVENAAPAPSGPSGTIQLGAFSSSAKAEQVWRSLSARFGYLNALEKVVVPVASGDKTLYRLRASGPGASGLCARLRVAGETCSGV